MENASRDQPDSDQTKHLISLIEKYEMSYADALHNGVFAALHYLSKGSINTMNGGRYFTFGRRSACYHDINGTHALVGPTTLLPAVNFDMFQVTRWFDKRGFHPYIWVGLMYSHLLVDDHSSLEKMLDLTRHDYLKDYLAAGKHYPEPDDDTDDPANSQEEEEDDDTPSGCHWQFASSTFQSSTNTNPIDSDRETHTETETENENRINVEWPLFQTDCATAPDHVTRVLEALEECKPHISISRGWLHFFFNPTRSANQARICEDRRLLEDLLDILDRFYLSRAAANRAFLCGMAALSGSAHDSAADGLLPSIADCTDPLLDPVAFQPHAFGAYRSVRSLASLATVTFEPEVMICDHGNTLSDQPPVFREKDECGVCGGDGSTCALEPEATGTTSFTTSENTSSAFGY
jgi:hypothetical protein